MMNTPRNAAAGQPQQLDDAIYRWEGHMSDGVGATYGTEPLAFLCASSDKLLLSGNRGTYNFSPASIERIGRAKMYPWFFAGIRIHHDNAGYPAEIQFQSRGVRSSEILSRLKALGYPVA